MKFRISVLAAILPLLLCSCSKEEVQTILSFAQETVNVCKDDSGQVQLQLQYSKGTDGAVQDYDLSSNPLGVTFTSSLPGVATVDEQGKVVTYKTGITYITAEADGCVAASCKIIVTSKIEETDPLTIGSFNLWVHATGTDEWAWDKRKTVLAQSIVENGFDIFGFQEADATIRSELPSLVKAAGGNYTWWFVCRDNQAATSGEAIGIAYNPDKISISDQHYFWLSPTPDVLSYGWDETSYHRQGCCAVCTVKANGAKFFFMATHGPLASTANANAGQIFIDRTKMYNTENLPCFLVGDMNAHYNDALSKTCRTYWNDPVLTLGSSRITGPVGTFNSHNTSRNMNSESYRIDYVYYLGSTSHLYVTSYKCNDKLYNGIYPSDHLPVMITAKIY